MDAIIVAQTLTKRYKKVQAVRGIDLAVQRGEIFGLVGPDGAGKTTTIQMLVGILNPTAGAATVAGLDVVRDAARLGERIGYMSEGFTLYGTLSVEENLNFFADLHNVSRKERAARKERLLQFARLEPFRTRRVEQLSGGMQKKLALAGALIHTPQVLFLDEATAGVDPISRRQFWDLIFHIASQGVTVFVTTHYMDEAEHAHDLGLIYNGRLIANGSPQTLRANMRAGELIEIVSDQPVEAADVIADLPFTLHTAIFGTKVHALVEDAAASLAPMKAALRSKDVAPRSIEPVPLSLEDLFIVFIEMVERGKRWREEPQ